MTNYLQSLSLSPSELADFLVSEFMEECPAEIVSQEDMEQASKLLLKLTNSFSVLSTLLAYSKIQTREARRKALPKSEIDDCVDKKEVIQAITDAVKQQYAAVSRAVTIRIESNAELKMYRGN